MRLSRTAAGLSWVLLGLVSSAAPAGAAEEPAREMLLQEGGVVRQQGGRMDIFDRAGETRRLRGSAAGWLTARDL